MGGHYEPVALQSDSFALDLPAMLAAIEKHRPELIFLAYPNNPTGNLFRSRGRRGGVACSTGAGCP